LARGGGQLALDAVPMRRRLKNAARELPSKTIAKSFASLITYPHSEAKRFEKRASRDQT
jgi:hypothetical protein